MYPAAAAATEGIRGAQGQTTKYPFEKKTTISLGVVLFPAFTLQSTLTQTLRVRKGKLTQNLAILDALNPLI